MKSTVLVTGGAGFIGSHLVRRLLRDGYSVRVIDNLVTGFRRNLEDVQDAIDLVIGDICDPKMCAEVVDGVDVVFHVAALPSVPRSMKDPVATHTSNVTGTLYLLEAARRAGARRFVYSSSSSAYGDTPALPKLESMEPLPRSPYAAAKLAGEL
ncbi:MAG TPA: NAD-dependent epimerase/dehydratase family protein, partial [Gemmatimonadaceae bacterium]